MVGLLSLCGVALCCVWLSAALFGSSIFDEHYSLKDVKVVPAAPLDACSELSEQVPRQQVVLIERGGCNFTTKVLHAQNHGARAAIVFNNEETHR